MRRLVFIGSMCLLIIITGICIATGFNIGPVELWGVKEIRQENLDIDNENLKLSGLVETTYPNSVKDLDKMAEEMQASKTEYENKAVLLSNSDYYLQTEEYEIEFLWTKIGNYAKDNDIIIKIEVTDSQLEGRYDLNFTAVGKYADVTQLIYDIENDSKLGFKIENFKMESSGDGVQATFSCKEIRINIDESIIKEDEIQEDNTTDLDTTENTDTTDSDTTESTNTTNSNTTDNSNADNTANVSGSVGTEDVIAEQ